MPVVFRASRSRCAWATSARAVERLSDKLAADTLGESIAIASLPDQVRGYEDIKLRRAKVYREELRKRLP